MNETTTKLNDLLQKTGVPFKDCWFGGSTGIITCFSFDAATKIARIMQAASFKVRGPVAGLDQTKASIGKKPETTSVYRLGISL